MAGRAAAVVVVALSALVAPTGALALTYNVTLQSDPPPANGTGSCAAAGPCSLRQAINTANGHSGADVITVPAGDYTRDGSLGTPGFTDAATLTGAGARATILHGSSATGVLMVNGGGTYDFRDFTVTGGNGFIGGGIVSNNASLTLTRTAIVGNRVTAICPLPPVGSPGTGGGLASVGSTPSLTLVDSVVANNHADGAVISGCGGTNGFGGGIALQGPMTATDSTIVGNDAGTSAMGFGGGISEQAGAAVPIVLKNVTLAGNKAVGTFGFGGNLVISSSAPHLSVSGSIISGGTAPSGGENCSLNGAGVTSGGGNVEDRDQCGLGASDRRNADPQLGPLQDNGGPTDTRAIPSSSPAVDFAGACGLAADQRGTSRPQGPACDAGAFELVPSSSGSGGGGSSGGSSQSTTGGGGGGVGPTAPACTITPSGNTAGLLVRVSCDRAASVTLGGDVTLTTKRRRHRAHRTATKTVALAGTSTQVAPGTALSLKVKIPASVVSAVKRGAKATAHLTLVAAVGTAQSQASSTFAIRKAPKKHKRRKR